MPVISQGLFGKMKHTKYFKRRFYLRDWLYRCGRSEKVNKEHWLKQLLTSLKLTEWNGTGIFKLRGGTSQSWKWNLWGRGAPRLLLVSLQRWERLDFLSVTQDRKWLPSGGSATVGAVQTRKGTTGRNNPFSVLFILSKSLMAPIGEIYQGLIYGKRIFFPEPNFRIIE